MKKNRVYLVGSKKYLCVIADKEISVMAPFSPHKEDSGYKTNWNKLGAWYQSIPPVEIWEIGKIKDNCYYPY